MHFKKKYLLNFKNNLHVVCRYACETFRQDICSLQVSLRNLSGRYMQLAGMSPKPFGKVYAVCRYISETFREGICSLHVCLRMLSEWYMQLAGMLPNVFYLQI